MVFDVGVKAFRDRIFNGPSTNIDCISMCIIIWRFCVDNNFLIEKYRNFLFKIIMLFDPFDLRETGFVETKREKKSDIIIDKLAVH